MASRSSLPDILIVEDQTTNINMLVDMLGPWYRLRIAKRGSDALKSIALKLPDLVLLDVGLPDIDGFEVARRILQDPDSESIPVIFLTAATSETEESRGLSLGAVDYIYKPFQPEIIKRRIKNQLELHAHRMHLAEMVAERTRELLETQQAIFLRLPLQWPAGIRKPEYISGKPKDMFS